MNASVPVARRTTAMRCRWFLLLFHLCCGAADLCAGDWHVDPIQGNDARSGRDRDPLKTIAQAIRLAQAGDTIHLRPMVYRDEANFFGKSGEPGRPITLDGHGATLEGCDPLQPEGWVEEAPGLFRHDDLLPLTDAIIDRWFFLWDGKPNRMHRCSKGPSEPLKKPDDLQPGEWTFIKDEARSQAARKGYIHGSFFLRLPRGMPLQKAPVEVPVRSAGVLVRDGASHLVVRNLTCTHPYNDGFNLSDCRSIQFKNIQAIDCGDDGISAHGDCLYQVDGFTSSGNATGICDTGNSVTSYRHVLIHDCIGFDLFFLDSGRYSLSDAVIDSSAAKSVYLLGRAKPTPPCTLTLENVLIERKSGVNEIRVSPNCRLTARNSTFRNLDVQAVGGDVEWEQCLLAGIVPDEPPRKPRLHLWPEATWRGVNNRYDLESLRHDRTTYTAATFNQFQQAVFAERNSRWVTAEDDDAASAGIGAAPNLWQDLKNVLRPR